jgi:hypothetical protein
MLVLLWGLAPDRPLSMVHERLLADGTPFFFLDQMDVLETEVSLRVTDRVEGTLTVRGQAIALDEVTAVYPRTYDSCRLAAIASQGPESEAWRHASQVDDLLLTWLSVTDALVVNRAAAMAGNDSKPAQLMQLHNLGWSVPETLITTDPEAAQSFWRKHGEVVYKSVSSVRSQVSRLRPEHAQRFADIRSCPTQFQRYIPGQDFRVHVVGEQVFGCEVVSGADDYRYDGSTTLRDFALPQDLARRCVELAASLELSLAGIDLRRTPAGEWFCFEVNTSPGFSYYEHQTGQPISRALARLLASAPAGRPAADRVDAAPANLRDGALGMTRALGGML